VAPPSAAKAADDKKDGKFRHNKGGHGQKEAKMVAVQAQPEKKTDENPPATQEKGGAGGPGPKGSHQQKQPTQGREGTKPASTENGEAKKAAALWKFHWVMGQECGQKHPPNICQLFVKISPTDKLDVIQQRNLCVVCFKHPDTSKCYLTDAYTKCDINDCGKDHHRVMHEAFRLVFVRGRLNLSEGERGVI